MADESIILAVEIDSKKALTQLDLLSQAVEDAKNKQDELNKQFKEGAISRDEYNKATKENTKEIKSAETATKSLTTAITAEKGSIAALSAENRELIKQRNLLSVTDANNTQKIAELNKQINQNNLLIKSSSSEVEKNRMNIGNYSSALEGVRGSLKGVVPGLGGMGNGLMGITAGAKAFTATPFGATLQIIAGLLSVLTESFKGSEEGQKGFNKVTQVTTSLLATIGELVRNLGKYLIDTFSNPKQALLDLADFLKNNLINRFKAFSVILDGIVNLDFKKTANGILQIGSGVENTIEKVQQFGNAVTDVANKALEQGNKVAKLQADIEDLEDEAALRRAQNDIKVAKLREDAIKQEGDAKRKSIEEAIKLEEESADFSIKIAQKKVELAQAELATATNKKEAQDNLEDAEVALAQAQAERYQATLRFEKQLEGLNDAQIKALEKEKQEQEKLAEEEKKRNEQREAEYQKWIEREEDLLKRERDAALARRLLQNEQLANDAKTLDEKYELLIKNEEISRNFQLKNTELTEQEKQLIIEQSNAKIVALNKQKDTQIKANEDKTNAQRISSENNLRNLKQKAALDTLGFITGLLKEGSQAQKIAALAEIAANVGIGISNGLRIAQQTAMAGGPAAAFAFPAFYATQISAVLAAAAQAREIVSGGNTSGGISISSGGRSGVTATQATTNPINQTYDTANAFRNMPPVIASWQEATTIRNRVEFKEQLTTV